MSETDCIMAAGELQAIIDRQNRENARVNARTALAQRQAYTAAAELACRMGSEDPSLRRVILFGSTLPQAVDVIALDELRLGILERVLTEGVVLYEAQ